MSAQVFADKWEWLSKQSNWRKILNDAGISRIKRGWTVEQTVEVVRAQFPNTALPWGSEGGAFQKKLEQKQRLTRYNSMKKELRRLAVLVSSEYRNIIDSYPTLLSGATNKTYCDVIKTYLAYKNHLFDRYSNYVKYLYDNDLSLHPTTSYQMFNQHDIPAYVPLNGETHFPGTGMNLGLWLSYIESKVITDIATVRALLQNALLSEAPVKLPTLPKHICQEYFDFAKMAEVEKKCIVCLESDNMLLSTCGHVICQGCFVELRKQPQFKCPECRHCFPKE